MLKAMVDAGHEVIALAPEDDGEVRQQLRCLGVDYRPVFLNRTGLNPLQDLRSLVGLYRVFRELRPQLLLTYAIKPVIWGSLAARLAGVPLRFAMITGLGSGLQGQGLTRRLLSRLARGLYRISLLGCKGILFQNSDDCNYFKTWKLVPQSSHVTMINGSGVDLAHFAATPPPPGPIRFLMVARMIRDKGLLDFIEAVRILRPNYPDVRFELLGPLDSNPTAVSRKELESWVQEGLVDYLGETRDVRPFLSAAQVFVLPSFGEGTPRSALEAMATGRAVITTYAPGCREVVLDGESGFLVPVHDPVALAEAMAKLIEDPSLMQVFGRAGRHLAESKYNVHAVNGVILEALGLKAVGTPGESS